MLAAVAAAGNRLAHFPSDPLEGAVAQGWRTELDQAGATLEDGLRGAEAYLAVKDEEALAEMTLAVAASLAWSVLPDGPARSAAFMLAGSTWLVTIAVNVSPLMRFDGYFLLSDWLNEPNLQDRSFALGRWWVREVLFRFRDPVPEILPDGRRHLLIAYAIACWIYRFTLFMGIAVLVYNLAFKLLGLFLMSVEVGWFIVRPILMELAVWPRRLRSGGVTRRAAFTGSLFMLLIAAFVLPWRESVFAPGLLRAERQIGVIVPEPGQLVSLTGNGAAVGAGQTLFVLDNPDLANFAAQAEAEIAGLKTKIAGQAFDSAAASDLPVAWQHLESAYARLSDAHARQAQMAVKAPFAGRLLDVPRDIRTGVWLPKREQLGILVDPAAATAEALVSESDIGRIKRGDKARFWPESGEDTVAMTVRDISPTAVAVIDAPELASVHGGGVPARREQDGRLKPEAAVYRVVFVLPDGTVAPPGIRRGSVRIEGTPQSFADRVWRRVVAVAMREAGL
jgi:putative peptide zinc metalloprotease protein